jgi:predicted N-acetyltransferase YhbS
VGTGSPLDCATLIGYSMTDLSLTILPETADDEIPIERLHERTFGPGRFARTAYRLREGVPHDPALSYTVRIGTLLVGSLRLSAVCIGETKALMLGPLTIEPPFQGRGIAKSLMEHALKAAKEKGYRLVVLVGDEPYYARVGFKPIAKGVVSMPGPVDPARLLVNELVPGAFEGVSGPIRPDWDYKFENVSSR